MDKKGQGLPWQVIIIGIIVILVLVVIGVIFGQQNKKFVGTLGSEEDKIQKSAIDGIKGVFTKQDADDAAEILAACNKLTEQTCSSNGDCKLDDKKCVPR